MSDERCVTPLFCDWQPSPERSHTSLSRTLAAASASSASAASASSAHCAAHAAHAAHADASSSIIAQVAQLLARARRVVVLCGAGLSASHGVPDFRSPGGLHELVRARFGLPDAQLAFDREYLSLDPAPFFFCLAHLAGAGYERRSYAQNTTGASTAAAAAVATPTRGHALLATLAATGRLRRVLTQNVDGLERAAGVPRRLVVPCHGTIETARCLACKARYAHGWLASAPFADALRRGEVLRCVRCARADNVVCPDLVLFGEAIRPATLARMHADIAAADVLLVVGTSLAVAPASELLALAAAVNPHAPRVLVNREMVAAAPQQPRAGRARLALAAAADIRAGENAEDVLVEYHAESDDGAQRGARAASKRPSPAGGSDGATLFTHVLLGECDDIAAQLIELLNNVDSDVAVPRRRRGQRRPKNPVGADVA